MGHSPEAPQLSAAELEGYSLAALAVAGGRKARGYDTAYDVALCRYVGDPTPGSPAFRPQSRPGRNGKDHQYNDPLRRISAYSDGYLVHARWSQSFTKGDDERDQLLVATANLAPGLNPEAAITEWRVARLERVARTLTVVLNEELPGGRARRALRGAVGGEFGNSGIARARLVLDTAIDNALPTPVAFHVPGDDNEVQDLRPAHELITEVNELTRRLRIPLGAEALSAA